MLKIHKSKKSQRWWARSLSLIDAGRLPWLLILCLFQRLRSFLDIPDYPCYLVYIVALPDGDEHIRSVAALVLKNVASTTLTKWAPEVLEFVKQNIIVAHNDTAVLVRNAAGQVVVAILDVLGPVNWPDCLNHLITNLDAPEIDKQLVSRMIKLFAIDQFLFPTNLC